MIAKAARATAKAKNQSTIQTVAETKRGPNQRRPTVGGATNCSPPAPHEIARWHRKSVDGPRYMEGLVGKQSEICIIGMWQIGPACNPQTDHVRGAS